MTLLGFAKLGRSMLRPYKEPAQVVRILLAVATRRSNIGE